MSAPYFFPDTFFTPELAPEFSFLPAPHPDLQACVVIPARDEADTIERTLDAFAQQQNGEGVRLPAARFEVLLGCNNCRDDTATQARAWSARHPNVTLHVVETTSEPGNDNVGWARRTLMDAAYTRLGALPSDSQPRVICSTDADTRVFPNWVSAILDEVAAGAEAVGGRIYVERDGDRATRRTYLLDTAYRLSVARLESLLDPQPHDPWPRHFQFFGASLALTPAAYSLVGGLPPVVCLEDMALERQLRRHDMPIRHSLRVAVLTSARISGRVQTGLSTQLGEWRDESSARWTVPSGREIAARVGIRRRLKNLFEARKETPNETDWQQVAESLLMSPQGLRERARAATHFGALWDDVWETAWSNARLRERWRPVGVEEALRELRTTLIPTAPSC